VKLLSRWLARHDDEASDHGGGSTALEDPAGAA